MAYEKVIEPKDGYLKVSISGTRSVDNYRELALDIKQRKADPGQKALLLDLRRLKGQQPGFISYFELAEYIAPLASLRFSRIALLYMEENKPFAIFFESAARNMGLDFRAFFIEEEAVRWLKEAPPAELPDGREKNAG